jgi:hypothetical protein
VVLGLWCVGYEREKGKGVVRRRKENEMGKKESDLKRGHVRSLNECN